MEDTQKLIEKIKKYKIEVVPMEKIMPYENNPRNNEDAVEKVKNSILNFGFTSPLVLNGEGIIINGHTRYRAAKRIGLEALPCYIVPDLTKVEEKALRLADNKVAEFSNWDYQLLEMELVDIEDYFNVADFGFTDVDVDDFALESLFEDAEEKAEEEEKHETVICPHCGEEFEL